MPFHIGSFLLLTALAVHQHERGTSLLWLTPLSVLIGMNFAGLAFVAHEALHGAIVRGKTARRIVGAIGFFPFWVSPRLWIAWHNTVHHGNTNIEGKDPDAYPSLKQYEDSTAARLAVDLAAPRSRKLRGIFTLLIGFTGQSMHVLLSAHREGLLLGRHFALALAQTLGAMAAWCAFALSVGGPLFLLLYVAPLMIGNSIVMAHIITNHSLSPLSDTNDALETSLTVRVPRWFEFYSLGFGYHVEHHLFPAMSNRNAPIVAAHLRLLAPDSYQEMPLTSAIRLLFTTPRVYRDKHTLFDFKTGEIYPTLGSTHRLTADGNKADSQKILRRVQSFTLETTLLQEAENDASRSDSVPPPSSAA